MARDPKGVSIEKQYKKKQDKKKLSQLHPGTFKKYNTTFKSFLWLLWKAFFEKILFLWLSYGCSGAGTATFGPSSPSWGRFHIKRLIIPTHSIMYNIIWKSWPGSPYPAKLFYPIVVVSSENVWGRGWGGTESVQYFRQVMKRWLKKKKTEKMCFVAFASARFLQLKKFVFFGS